MNNKAWWQTTRGTLAFMLTGAACYALIVAGETGGLVDLAKLALIFFFSGKLIQTANGRGTP